MRHPENIVVCRSATDYIVGFVNGVQEVEGDDEDVETAVVAGVAGGAADGDGVAGAREETVEDCEGPGGDEL